MAARVTTVAGSGRQAKARRCIVSTKSWLSSANHSIDAVICVGREAIQAKNVGIIRERKGRKVNAALKIPKALPGR